MSPDAHKLSLFGLNLRELWATFRAGWAEALDWPVFSWLQTQQPVRLLMSDGSVSMRRGPSAIVMDDSPRGRFNAVELSEDLVLTRTLVLPDLPRSEVERALAIEVETCSPFGPEGTVWGWRSIRGASGAVKIILAMARREDAERAIYEAFGNDSSGEVWVDSANPIVLKGFGEQLRLRRERRDLSLSLLGISVVALLIMLLVVTPFLHLRQRVLDAQFQFSALSAKSETAVAARANVLKRREQIEAIEAQLADGVEMLDLLERLTNVVPDTDRLLQLDVRGRVVRLAGQGTGGSRLVSRLADEPAFVDVRSTSPITKVANTAEERFSVEFRYVVPDGAAN